MGVRLVRVDIDGDLRALLAGQDGRLEIRFAEAKAVRRLVRIGDLEDEPVARPEGQGPDEVFPGLVLPPRPAKRIGPEKVETMIIGVHLDRLVVRGEGLFDSSGVQVGIPDVAESEVERGIRSKRLLIERARSVVILFFKDGLSLLE